MTKSKKRMTFFAVCMALNMMWLGYAVGESRAYDRATSVYLGWVRAAVADAHQQRQLADVAVADAARCEVSQQALVSAIAGEVDVAMKASSRRSRQNRVFGAEWTP